MTVQNNHLKALGVISFWIMFSGIFLFLISMISELLLFSPPNKMWPVHNIDSTYIHAGLASSLLIALLGYAANRWVSLNNGIDERRIKILQQKCVNSNRINVHN